MSWLFAYLEKMAEGKDSRVEKKVRSRVRSGGVATNDAQNFSMYLFNLFLMFCDML